jgi:Reverse transcriptase (RNA-dependent DNA polymerase)
MFEILPCSSYLHYRVNVLRACLDLSAAFDTVDHEILLQRLQVTYGIHDTVHKWFRSYLLGRTQYVRRGLSKSSMVRLMCGVPQGSVLGPILFILYTAELIALIEDNGLSSHLYADDTQVYGSCRPAAVDEFSLKVSECVGVVSSWMRSNRLQLNTDKTEVLWCATGRRQHQLPTTALSIDGVSVVPVPSVRNLGVFIDADLVMRTHVQRTVSRCFAALRQLRQIRRSVPTATIQTLVVALVLSRLDYGNGVLVDLPAYLVRRLQSVQNAAGRLIYNLRRSDHITDALASLHWLRIPERVVFKVAVLTFKVLHGSAPEYLGPVIRVADLPGRQALRSAGTNRLVVPPFKLSTIGRRAFPVAGPQIWNNLPEDITSLQSLPAFRRRLKTHLFSRSFPNLNI